MNASDGRSTSQIQHHQAYAESTHTFVRCHTSTRPSTLSSRADRALHEERGLKRTQRRPARVAVEEKPGGTPSAPGRCPCPLRRSARTRDAFEWKRGYGASLQGPFIRQCDNA
ncbi:hypothetical protein PMAYCL1PPCAC_19798 [Pristionchus mayeri]|uniref:Uncharacterized protein n=1 Tax=Pristionchus mayeri TaxID=1317129 RepID=A0AAN5I2K6_9BILA|nr:hypothetical protein PMAYCL1PPCAC_19798 [Pristionchus mayeri]